MNWKRLFSFRGEVGRERYLTAGVVLVVVKYALDVALSVGGAGVFWSPFSYWGRPGESQDSQTFPWMLYLGHAAIALPFVWIGTALTVQRLRNAAAPLPMVVLFFLPYVNLLFFGLMCVLPPKSPGHRTAPVRGFPGPIEPPPKLLDRSTESLVWGFVSALIAALAAALLTWVLVDASTTELQLYGYGLFMGAPFGAGMLAAIIFGSRGPKTLGSSLQVALASQLICAFGLLLVASEGFICLLMALPIAVPLAMIGAAIGFQIQEAMRGRHAGALFIPLFLSPLALLIEDAMPRRAELFEVTTSIRIAAPPKAVWKNVVAFSELEEPNELLFRAGIAYPKSARIEGEGKGAVRHCVFSTGAFVEPITTWREPELLAFSVTSSPPPMKELNPFGEPTPLHLEGFLVSERGQFRLVPQADGGTLLVGTTWYRHRMAPAGYWRLWSDPILHAIHTRVLSHIKELSEAKSSNGVRTKRP